MLAALALALAAPATGVQPLVRLPENIGGRVVREPGGHERFGWPGVYFEGQFRGSTVTVDIDAPNEQLRLLVDGRERMQLERPVHQRLVVDALGPGRHVVRLEKQTESQSGGGSFGGFFVARSAVLPAPRHAGQIEFIGDSYTVGYGNTSPTSACTRQEVHDRTDSQQAFGPLVAKQHNWDYRLIAFSGQGMVRNYNGSSPELSLPILYPRAIPGEPGSIESNGRGWKPAVIVINLGTNDFSTMVHPGERWKDRDALAAAYRERYIAFVRERHAAQPQARIILMASDKFSKDVRRVVAALKQSGLQRVEQVDFGPLIATGCDGHPSLEDDRRMASLIEGVLKPRR